MTIQTRWAGVPYLRFNIVNAIINQNQQWQLNYQPVKCTVKTRSVGQYINGIAMQMGRSWWINIHNTLQDTIYEWDSCRSGTLDIARRVSHLISPHCIVKSWFSMLHRSQCEQDGSSNSVRSFVKWKKGSALYQNHPHDRSLSWRCKHTTSLEHGHLWRLMHNTI